MMMLMMDLQVRLFVARRGVGMGVGLDDIGHYYYYYQQYWENEGVKGIGSGHKSGSEYKRPGEAARTMSGL